MSPFLEADLIADCYTAVMRNRILAVLLIAAAAGCRATTPEFDARERGETARSVIADWDGQSRVAAAVALERYGAPDALAEDGLGWRKRGSWARVVVRQGGGVRQTVSYRVPEDKLDAVQRFGLVEVTEDEMSATAVDERLNVLALNLADEVARGARKPDEARALYDKILGLEAAGKSSPLLESIRFKTN